MGPLVLLGLTFVGVTGCDYESFPTRVLQHDPGACYTGETVFISLVSPAIGLFSVNMKGDLLWAFEDNECGQLVDFEVLPNRDILFACTSRQVGVLRPPGTILWEDAFPGVHHSVVMLPWGNILHLTERPIQVEGWTDTLLSDAIQEVVPETGEIVWSWNIDEHFSPQEHYCPLCMDNLTPGGVRDWSHSNALHFYEQDSTILLNSRNLNTFMMISYPSGDIAWACGTAGTFGGGLFYHAHDPELLPNGNVLLFDNDEHGQDPRVTRALELRVDPIAETAEVVWEWEDDLWAPWMGDANRLPNGNTLVTEAYRGRIIEVSPSGEKVWDMILDHPLERYHHFYKAERIPPPECETDEPCDDGNVCTEDACVDFHCVHTNNTVPCDDGDACTMRDACSNGLCLGEPLDEDGDTYVSEACEGDDCDDADPDVNPGTNEGPGGEPICTDGLDNDCDDRVDQEDSGCQA